MRKGLFLEFSDSKFITINDRDGDKLLLVKRMTYSDFKTKLDMDYCTEIMHKQHLMLCEYMAGNISFMLDPILIVEIPDEHYDEVYDAIVGDARLAEIEILISSDKTETFDILHGFMARLNKLNSSYGIAQADVNEFPDYFYAYYGQKR